MTSESLPAPDVRPPRLWRQVCIVGLGLLGGSFAAGLRRIYPQIEIVGVDEEAVLSCEAAEPLIDRGVCRRDRTGALAAIRGSDLVFLAATVGGIETWLPVALGEARLVTDCGSTKRSLVSAARRCKGSELYVPGHPMAGALGGLSGARGDLFQSQPWILCPEGVAPSALSAVTTVVEELAAKPILMNPGEHDRVVAMTSHVPRLMASSLARIAAQHTAFGAAGPAFERLVRGAGGATSMWSDILRCNRDEIAASLRLLIADLGRCAEELEGGQKLDYVLSLLEAAEEARKDFKK